MVRFDDVFGIARPADSEVASVILFCSILPFCPAAPADLMRRPTPEEILKPLYGLKQSPVVQEEVSEDFGLFGCKRVDSWRSVKIRRGPILRPRSKGDTEAQPEGSC
ncbi:hypothetical protein AKJ16_DCAP26738 [Drosera capensis]